MSRGQGRVYERGGVWWIDYGLHGQRFRESTKGTSKRAALELLRQRIGDRKDGKLTGSPDKVRLAEYAKGEDGANKLVGGLRALAERQYTLDGRRSLARLKQCWEEIETFFPGARALEITPGRLSAYAEHRLAQGAAPATVGQELSALRRGFRLAVEQGLLATMPRIKLPKVRNARAGFFSDGDVAALLTELPEYVRPVVRFALMTGWRKSEILSLRWDQIDWEGQVIRLAAVDTKGDAARVFPIVAELRTLLETQLALRPAETFPYVFHRYGKRISGFYKVWEKACKRAGLEGRILHDCRRTAARAFRQAGVSEGEIMKLCGWKTRSMFDRYNIIDEADLAQAVAKRFNGTNTAQSAPADPTPASLSSSVATSDPVAQLVEQRTFNP
jgi:integrase